MKRIGAQPVHLAKNKKKEKENISVLYQQPTDKENIDYDLMVFQESLKLNKNQHNQTFEERPVKSSNRQALVESVQFTSNTIKMAKKSLGRYEFKDNNYNSLANATPSTQRLEFSKDWQQFKNIHKTSACFKPVLNQEKIGRGNHSDNILNIICLRSKRGSAEGQLSKLDDQNAKKYLSIPTYQDAQWDHTVYQQRIQLMKKAYQAKISQMQSQNQSLSQNNQVLKQKVELQEEQKRNIIIRMETIQKQVHQLQNENKQIKAIEREIEKISSEIPLTNDCFTQTNNYPQRLTTSQRPESIEHLRSSLQLSDETWFIKAKYFKSELERQKIHAANLQAQLKVNLENKEIQWRQKYDRLEKQLLALNDKYQSKCIEVRDKENLLNRFLVSK